MTQLHYDLDRVVVLRRRTADALASLEAVRGGDPAAAGAIRAVRTAAEHLGQRWLPTLDRLAGSAAMRTWGAGGPPGLVIDVLDRLVALARRIEDDEVDEVDEMVELGTELDELDDDPAAREEFFRQLGAGETAALLLRLGTIADDDAAEAALDLAATLRRSLAGASGGLGEPFARALVDAFVEEAGDGWLNPAATVSHLVAGDDFDTDFLVGLTRALVEAELATADGEADSGFLIWPPTPAMAPPSTLLRTFMDDDGEPTDAFDLAHDPMYAVLHALADDSVAARAVLNDAHVAAYLMRDRHLQADGLRSLAAVGVAASVGPDVVAGAAAGLRRDAARAASAFVNLLAERDHDAVWFHYANPEVSEAAATILGRHLPAVQFALLHGDTVDPARGALVPLIDAVHGSGAAPVGALFDPAAVDLVSALAADTDDGIATIRTALDLHQADRAATAATRLSGGLAEPAAFLSEAVADAGRLEAHFIEHVGHRAEERGRSKDEVISFWIDLATFAVGQGSTAASVAVPMVGEALGPAAGLAKQLLADHEAGAARDATANADAAADQLTYVWYRQLYAAGVIAPALPSGAVDGGGLVSWQDFQELSDRDRAIVRSRMEETTGRHGINLDGTALRDVIKVQQLPIYRELE